MEFMVYANILLIRKWGIIAFVTMVGSERTVLWLIIVLEILAELMAYVKIYQLILLVYVMLGTKVFFVIIQIFVHHSLAKIMEPVHQS